jgi:uncharacterized protein
MYVKAINVSKSADLAVRVRVASSFVHRAVGLLGTASLPPSEGLWITPCKTVHTFFMQYPIDIAVLDEKGTVIDQTTLAPWRTSHWHKQARSILELSAGVLARSRTTVGDRIEFKESEN